MPTTTVDPIIAALLARGETLATAESLTGGLVGAMLTAAPGVSAVYRGGVIAYATELKSSLLGVPAAHLAEFGAVDEGTARLMAEGVRHACGADWGLATTGVAGPDPQEGKPVGTVHVAVAGPDGRTEAATLALDGNRKQIRAKAARAAFALLAGQVAPPGEASGRSEAEDDRPVGE
ncbi:CinA family protein [Propionibacteriaceae bacterium Y2011]